MRVAVIITARPSYARVQTVIAALVRRNVDVQIIACASALLERYGAVVHVIRKDFPDVPLTEVWSTYEGATLLTSAKETGALVGDLAAVLSRLRPDVAVVVADRHEVLGAAQAVAYQHIRLAHLQGGERTGSIDDKCRDAISHLADVHCVATANARYRVYGLTGDWDAIHVTGCPSVDVAHQARGEPLVTASELGGSGAVLDPSVHRFVVVLVHSVTSEAAQARAQWLTLTSALSECPAVVFWPGEEAGAGALSKAIRETAVGDRPWRTVRNLPPRRFLKLLTQATCLIGNSSVGIREASYLGVPVVNVGSRQCGRERAPNVVDVDWDDAAIWPATTRQIQHGPYASSKLYGDGQAGTWIAEVLCRS